MRNQIKKHAETFVETAVLLGIIAACVALALVLSGREDLVQSKNVQAVGWYLVGGLVVYVGYKIYRMKLNQK